MSRGFSLIECLIALTLFSLIAIIALHVLFDHRTRAENACAQVQALGLARAQALDVPIFPLPSEIMP